MINLIKADFFKQYCEIKNNKMKLAIGIIGNILILYALYSIEPEFTGAEIYRQYVYIYTIFWFVFSITTYVGNTLILECKTGTIEQLVLSKYGLKLNLLSKFLIQSIKSILFYTFVVVSLNVITGNVDMFSIPSLIVIFLGGIFTLYGIGLIIGSIALISKELNYIAMIFRFLIVYILFKLDTSILIPFSYANKIIRDILIGGYNLYFLNGYDIFYLILNSIVYFLIGLYIFSLSEKRMISKGTMVGY